MAAPMKIVLQNSFITYSRASVVCRCAVANRKYHSQSRPDDEDRSTRVPQVVMSADSGTLIGWHPEPEHPYEHTQPVPYNMREAKEGSVLKDAVIRDYLTRYRPTGPNMAELSAITYTTKHQWFPKPETKYKKKNPPRDRDAM